MRTKRNVSPRLSSTSVITLLRSYHQSKERRTRLCEKSDRKQGKKCSTSPLFSLFLSVFFRKQRHPSTDFSKRKHQELRRLSKCPCKKLHPTTPSTQKHATEEPADAGYAHSRPPNLRALPPPSRVSFARKKTATHLPMDSCLKVCGR